MLKVNIAAYCRVSTDKSDQLNSLEAQKKFFAEFTERNGHNLVRLYADEGISGTKIKNRKEFQRLMRDAKQGLFEMVVVKDISRFARNTVDFLQSIRALKALGIETTFLTANMTVLGNSEFVLTIFGALAQEESANTSKRVKFGKKLNAEKGWEICIHVDAATGGFIHPFIDPDTVWDFRLKWVLSISVSGHKFGLVYPGVGWVVWKDKQYLPEEMNFAVNYLGANIPSISINFSRPGNQVLAQYYQFLRLGMEGYRQIQQNCIDVCLYLKQQLKEMGIFEFFSDDMPNPLFIWKLKNDSSRKWTLYDLSDALHAQGWQVPAYTMPKNMEDVVIMRVVVRQGTGKDLADLLVKDIKTNIAQLNQLQEPTNSAILWNKREPQKPRGFNHSR
mgnify:CR=1 FL=1